MRTERYVLLIYTEHWKLRKREKEKMRKEKRKHPANSNTLETVDIQ